MVGRTGTTGRTGEGKKRVLAALIALGDVFGKELSQTVMGLYLDALADLSAEQVEQAAARALRECKFFPRPAELREFAGGNERLSLEDMAELQATEAINAINSVGPYRSVSFADPATSMVIAERFGGWPAFCLTDPDELKWLRKDFVKAYCTYARTGCRGYSKLPGISENQNVLNGIAHKEEPAMIGQGNQPLAIGEDHGSYLEHLS